MVSKVEDKSKSVSAVTILQLEAEPGKEAWIWVILSLKCLIKELQIELVESGAGREPEAFLGWVLFM